MGTAWRGYLRRGPTFPEPRRRAVQCSRWSSPVASLSIFHPHIPTNHPLPTLINHEPRHHQPRRLARRDAECVKLSPDSPSRCNQNESCCTVEPKMRETRTRPAATRRRRVHFAPARVGPTAHAKRLPRNTMLMDLTLTPSQSPVVSPPTTPRSSCTSVPATLVPRPSRSSSTTTLR